MADQSPIRQYLNSRMERALEDAADQAEAFEAQRGIPLPPEMVGEMALTFFQARMTLAMSDTSGRAGLPQPRRRTDVSVTMSVTYETTDAERYDGDETCEYDCDNEADWRVEINRTTWLFACDNCAKVNRLHPRDLLDDHGH